MNCRNQFIAYITTVPERLHTAYLETGFVGLAGGGVGVRPRGEGERGGRVPCRLVAVCQSVPVAAAKHADPQRPETLVSHHH